MKSVSGASNWTVGVITSIFIGRKKTLLEPLTAFSTKPIFLTFNSRTSQDKSKESKGWDTSASQVQCRPGLTVFFTQNINILGLI